MEVSIEGAGPTAPFLSARDIFETEFDLDLPVRVRIQSDPDERTWAGHYDEYHVLNISTRMANSALARELVLHEYAHMHRYETRHPSHIQSIEEVLFLALSGEQVEQTKLIQCHQIANHVKDVYADDIALSVGPADKLVSFFESELATAVGSRNEQSPTGWTRLTPRSDPDITAINAAFVIGLLERHNLSRADHRIDDLAGVAAQDAPVIDFEWFKDQFRHLAHDPDKTEYRRTLVDILRKYAVSHTRQAAD